MATIEDVAREAGVSIATVSRVLSPGRPPHPVQEDTARRVREAAARLDFVPSALARGLASQRSGLLGLVVPDLADPHYPQIAQGIEDVARPHGLALLVCNTLGDHERFRAYLRLLRARRVDAVLVSGGGSLAAEELDLLASTPVPCVLIGRPTAKVSIPYVAVDNVAAAREATRHLVASGRRRIVHLAGPATQTTMADRATGYREALAEHGLPERVVCSDGSAEDGFHRAHTLLREDDGERPEAVFAATDRLAVAVLAAAHDCAVRVPDELALVGFDDLSLVDYVRPSLSTVAQPARELGQAAIQLALRAIDGSETHPIVLPARLVLRASSGATDSRVEGS